MFIREVDRLENSNKDIDVIIYDTNSDLGKARIAFDTAFVKEKDRDWTFGDKLRVLR